MRGLLVYASPTSGKSTLFEEGGFGSWKGPIVDSDDLLVAEYAKKIGMVGFYDNPEMRARFARLFWDKWIGVDGKGEGSIRSGLQPVILEKMLMLRDEGFLVVTNMHELPSQDYDVAFIRTRDALIREWARRKGWPFEKNLSISQIVESWSDAYRRNHQWILRWDAGDLERKFEDRHVLLPYGQYLGDKFAGLFDGSTDFAMKTFQWDTKL